MNHFQFFGNDAFNAIIHQVKENAVRGVEEKNVDDSEKFRALLKQSADARYKNLHQEGVQKINEKGKDNEGKVPPPVFTTSV